MNKKGRAVWVRCFAPLLLLGVLGRGVWPADPTPRSAPKPRYRAIILPMNWVGALNNRGDVAGTGKDGSLLYWHKNRLQVLAKLPFFLTEAELTYSHGLGDAGVGGLSDDGRITGAIGASWLENGFRSIHVPFTWEKGSLRRGSSRIGREFDNKGRRVGAEFIGKEIVAPSLNYSTDEVSKTTRRAHHAVLYDASGKSNDLGVLPGMDWSKAAAINEKGQVAGTSGALEKRAFIWQNGAMQSLGTLPNITKPRIDTSAYDINERGQIVGSAEVGDDYIREWVAFLWQNGTMVDLDTITQLPPKAHLWEGLAINDKGQILAHGDDGEGLCNFLLTPIKQ